MAIIDIITAFSASGVLGGITGLIGNELKSRRELKMLKIQGELDAAAWPERANEREHEILMRSGNFEHELKLHEINKAAKSEENEHAIMSSETEFSGQGLVQALKNEVGKVNEPAWTAAVRTLTRPFIVAVLLILLSAIYFTSPQDGKLIITSAVVYMACVGVLFYFGDRPSSGMRKMLLGMGGTS